MLLSKMIYSYAYYGNQYIAFEEYPYKYAASTEAGAIVPKLLRNPY